MIAVITGFRALTAALVDPVSACRRAIDRPVPLGAGAAFLVTVTALGAATLPRQLQLLAVSLAPVGIPGRDATHQALAAGLSRLVWFDRLVPPPTAVIAGLLVLLAADSVLGLARDARARIATVVVLGLTPVLVQRLGELVMTYAAGVPVPLTPGWAIGLPREFLTGPALIWRHGAPAWLQAVSPRASLITAWSVFIWATGLRELDGGSWRLWHFSLPAACLVAAGIATWWFEHMVVALILGRP